MIADTKLRELRAIAERIAQARDEYNAALVASDLRPAKTADDLSRLVELVRLECPDFDPTGKTMEDIVNVAVAIADRAELRAQKEAKTKTKARKMKEPSGRAFQAYALWRLEGMKQERICARLGNVAQPKVSRWCKAVAKWLAAGNPMPAAIGRHRTITADPSAIDIGERRDGRTPRQRPRVSDEE